VNIGSIEALFSLSCQVLVSNVVGTYRSGIMDRVCWAQNAVNEGAAANPFKMKSMQAAVRLMREGDWMFIFDVKKGNFQIPLKHSFQEFTYMRIGEHHFR
jgi:hypothetical protein